MAQSLAEIMTRDVLLVDPSDTIGEAAQKMTERDVMRAVAGRVHSSEARVREWMTADPVTVSEHTPVEEAGRIMLENGFRHLPVVEGERAVGIVSIRDLAQWGLEHAE